MRVVDGGDVDAGVFRQPADGGGDQSGVAGEPFDERRVEAVEDGLRIIDPFDLGRDRFEIVAVPFLRIQKPACEPCARVDMRGRFLFQPAGEPIEHPFRVCRADGVTDRGVGERCRLPRLKQLFPAFGDRLVRPNRMGERPQAGLIDPAQLVAAVAGQERGRVALFQQGLSDS